jgi:hypothetical protein
LPVRLLSVPGRLSGLPVQLFLVAVGLLSVPARLLGLPVGLLPVPVRLSGLPVQLFLVAVGLLSVPVRLLGLPVRLLSVPEVEHTEPGVGHTLPETSAGGETAASAVAFPRHRRERCFPTEVSPARHRRAYKADAVSRHAPRTDEP